MAGRGGRRPGAGRKRTKPFVEHIPGPHGGARPGAGGKPFEPTVDQHNVVEKGAAFGLTAAQIRLLITNPETDKPISLDTLNQYFKEDLARGRPKAIMAVAASLYNNATRHNNVTAQIFYLKTQGRWSEKLDITVRRPDDMSDEELDAAIAAALETDPGAADPALWSSITEGESSTRH